MTCFSKLNGCGFALTVALLLSTHAGVSAQDHSTEAMKEVAPQDNPGGEEINEYPLADLPPLKRLVLYNSGVGQLQHEGMAVNKQRFEIKFSAHDVDDVLKSLMFADMGGGAVRAVEYQPAPEPEDVAANTVGMPMTLAQLLQRFRGESVTLAVGGVEYSGLVYGVESRNESDGVQETVVLIADDGMKSVKLSGVDRVQFDNVELRGTIAQAMQGIVKSRKANQKTLELLLDGEGKREIKFAYVVDMPIWRMTYRLAVKESGVYLQGWAHVDNVTGVDWEQVALELRSGKPQSFHINIFAPLMAERPDFGNSVYEFTDGLLLVTQWFGFAPGRFGGDDDMTAGEGSLGGGGGFGGGGGGFLGGEPSRNGSAATAGVDIESAFRQAAQESRTAQMVQYILEKPVDLGAGRSAALPVFSNQIPAKLISVFNEGDQGKTPFRAVQITNDTGLAIVSGPVSIVRDGDFVGDGKLGRLDVDEITEIVYGVDRAVEVVAKQGNKNKSNLVAISIDAARGIKLQRQVTRSRIFAINNRDTQARELVLYCAAADQGRAEELSPQPQRVRDGLARFSILVPPRTLQDFEVVYTQTLQDRKEITGKNARDILRLMKPDVEVDEGIKSAIQKVVDFEIAKTAAKAKLSELKEQKTAMEFEQTRVRDNVKVLTNNPDAAKLFLEKLQASETQIEAVNQQMEAKQTELNRIEEQQNEAIQVNFGKD